MDRVSHKVFLCGFFGSMVRSVTGSREPISSSDTLIWVTDGVPVKLRSLIASGYRIIAHAMVSPEAEGPIARFVESLEIPIHFMFHSSPIPLPTVISMYEEQQSQELQQDVVIDRDQSIMCGDRLGTTSESLEAPMIDRPDIYNLYGDLDRLASAAVQITLVEPGSFWPRRDQIAPLISLSEGVTVLIAEPGKYNQCMDTLYELVMTTYAFKRLPGEQRPTVVNGTTISDVIAKILHLWSLGYRRIIADVPLLRSIDRESFIEALGEVPVQMVWNTEPSKYPIDTDYLELFEVPHEENLLIVP